ncbi:hypothetical protein CH063_15685 [Colletotrichum higginsianum]|uniref:Uncharacterized protein n=1 Tax=Colletotrichum higginsianum (strain IMI 349063) TaxID=759273 RepID=H1W3Z4_COLHI|nr:hypothetical protein CH063_15685 [Colletotrichum higginsianum]
MGLHRWQCKLPCEQPGKHLPVLLPRRRLQTHHHPLLLHPPPPAAPPSRARAGSGLRSSMLDPSAFTLAPNGAKSPSPTRSSTTASLHAGGGGGGGGGQRYIVQDPRWKFQDEAMLPKPRDFVGGPRRYRAGRGSSVPLDLSAL